MPPTAGVEPGAASLAARTMERGASLAGFSEEAGRLTRRFATVALAESGAEVGRWMEAAGMGVALDAVGNVRGRYEGAKPGAPALLLGSHLDTVRDAGRWDGALGVLLGLALVERLHEEGRRLPFALELVGFADEEGVRYGVAYLGSSALVGSFAAEWFQRRDEEGILMAEALRAVGGDPDEIAAARREGADLLGYLETHIEQGPVLEEAAVPVGVVTGIAGQTRLRAVFEGRAGHAGTVPQARRRDALCAAAGLVVGVDAIARENAGTVATVGELMVEPGAPNVIPGRVELSVDVRHLDDARRARVVAQIRELGFDLAAERYVELSWETVLEQAAVACDEAMTARLETAVIGVGLPIRRLASGAGHDAAMLASLTPVAMLFVRCAGGISHHPDESVEEGDVAAAIEVLGRLLDGLAEEYEDGAWPA